ncbi:MULTISPECIES: helix-turn-helix domain-containing protein [Sphingobium]|jgi:AcrR family transcriptional regulator|uniref:Transcriptional regulator, tetr family n=1 Tax=Sphingobium fuliginis (strain ATCC 27551) TaxID=336203 RepID=A0A292ZBC1_SPHSA|nr:MULTISPECIES: helix-turn-helix domain-containing protein [Sphingobium]GAY22002.1 transcriptional regulator, tetr family [Sphingobium fuliginis]
MDDLPAQSFKGTALAIIEAAERLFGEHGIENVSLRQVRLEANAANNSAVSYHFNDREKLVRAIWAHRLPTLDARRRQMLDAIHAEGRERDPASVLGALVLPNYELRDAQGVHRYASFFRHAIRWREGTEIRNAQLYSTPASGEAMELYFALQPDVPRDLMSYRLRHGSCTFFDMIFERDKNLSEGLEVMPEAEFLAEGIEMLRAMCLRPAPGS